MEVSNKTKGTGRKLTGEQIQPIVILATLVVACLVFTIINSDFIKLSNLHSILLTAVPMALIAIGECTCIMAGYFDMSVGMIASLGGITAAKIITLTGSATLGVASGLIVGLVCGLLAGTLVSYLNMNAFITTFALQEVYRGLLYILTNGFPVSLFDDAYHNFTKWGQMRLFGVIQFPVIALIVIYVVISLFLKYKKLGRCIYLIGNNPQCAHICGVNLHSVQMFIFLLCDVIAAFAGMLYASRVASAQPFMGELLPMEAIAATIVGGTSLAGGKGNLALTFVGAIIIYIVKNGLIMAGLPDFYQYIAIGVILYFAIAVQVDRKKN